MKMKKWIRTTITATVLCLGLLLAGICTASAQSYQRWDTLDQNELAAKREGQLLFGTTKANGRAWQKINGVCYNGSGVAIPGAITRGIDVSEWQGTINWQKVKNSNVDFAFVRIAYGSNYLDKTYDYNMQQAELAGMPVGTYVYSTATTPAMALREAKLAIQKMDGYKVSYPVVYDLEYSQMGQLSPKQVAKLAVVFCNEVKKAGYYPMVYCNTNWYDNEVDWSYLNGIDVWIARYGDTIQAPSSSSYDYTIWQATDGDGGGTLNSTAGLISGIPSGNNVDIDFGYVDYTKIITPRWSAVSTYEPSTTPDLDWDDSDVSTGKNGWVTENGYTYYYKNDEKVKGWQKINGKYYYFSSKAGALFKDTLLTSSKNNICYVDEDGARVTNTWVSWEGKRYYMGSNGYAVKGSQKIGERYYFFDETSAYMYKSRKVIAKDGNIYYAGSNGWCCNFGFKTITEDGKKNTYYFGKNAKAYKGWHTINGKKYYFYKGNTQGSAVMARNITLTSGSGVVSVFNKNGVCIKQYKK